MRKLSVRLLMLVGLLWWNSMPLQAQDVKEEEVLEAWNETDDTYITLVNSIYAFDNALVKQDSVMLDKLLDDEVEITHSNGWVQEKADIAKDFADGTVNYESIRTEQIVKAVRRSNVANVDRIVKVKGRFKEYPFEIALNVKETWILEEDGLWRLLTRKSTKKV